MRSRSIKPEFATVVGGPDIRIKDPIERTEFDFHSLTEVELEPTSTDPFEFPVDAAVRVRTARLETAKNLNIGLFTPDGEMVDEVVNRQEKHIPHDSYLIQVLTSEMMIYLLVESSVSVTRTDRGVALDFCAEVDVDIGARSFHNRPAAIIDTSSDPEDMMEAVSMLSSSLKTTSPERSFPTSRGHPPLIALSDELRIPSELERPDTGVKIEVPREYESIYVVSSLAFYLGAEVVPGESPKLVTENGYEKSLLGPDGVHHEVNRILKQVFFLDCITRTEGVAKVEMKERTEVEPKIDLDLATLYELPLAEQLEKYLNVPYEALEPHMPKWKTTLDVQPEPDQVEMLSHAANDLALIRTPHQPDPGEITPQPKELVEFYRSTSQEVDCRPISPELNRVLGQSRDFRGSNSSTGTPEIINLESTESIEHVWAGDGFAIGAAKTSPDAYRHRFDVEPKDSIDVEIVCNDPEMVDENLVREIYGIEETYALNVTLHENVTTNELRDLFSSKRDFLHYIGHVTTDGIECSDGILDVRDLKSIGIRMFILNGCQSYIQGYEFVKRGSVAGVVTLSKVGNKPAVKIGLLLARLLNNGFPLQAALSVCTDRYVTGNQYVVVGDGGAGIVMSNTGSPVLTKITREKSSYSVYIESYPTKGNMSMGTLHMSYISDDTSYYLGSGSLYADELDKQEIDKYLNVGVFPVIYDGQIYWSNEISVDLLD